MQSESSGSGEGGPPTPARRSLTEIPPEELRQKLQELFAKFKASQQELAAVKAANQGGGAWKLLLVGRYSSANILCCVFGVVVLLQNWRRS